VCVVCVLCVCCVCVVCVCGVCVEHAGSVGAVVGPQADSPVCLLLLNLSVMEGGGGGADSRLRRY